MDTREMLEKAITHVIKQGEPSIDRNYNCKYRNSKGLMCAVGCLITDDNYKKTLEGKHAYSPKVLAAINSSIGRSLSELERDYLYIIQNCHDYAVEHMSVEFVYSFKERVKIKVSDNELPDYCLEFLTTQESQ